jgi:hypothetical protein
MGAGAGKDGEVGSREIDHALIEHALRGWRRGYATPHAQCQQGEWQAGDIFDGSLHGFSFIQVMGPVKKRPA